MSVVENQLVDTVRPIIWSDDHLELLDQRLLPGELRTLVCTDAVEVANAIRQMAVRGAPAIGIAAAYGVVLAARKAYQNDSREWRNLIRMDMESLAASRPTAVNLRWALQRMERHFNTIRGNPEKPLLEAAISIHDEDIAANRHMGELGAGIIGDCQAILTHCNTGSLATGGYGTALGVIRSVYSGGHLEMVYVDETRPWLQGTRLTAWELMQDNIPVTLLTDSAAGYLMYQGRIDWVIVGADRIAANGDVANKIGTYSLAVAARHHGLPMMVVAPTSTFDRKMETGKEIPIEDRGPDEILQFRGKLLAPGGVTTLNPVFDVTPASLVSVIVTERGVIEAPNRAKVAALLA